MGPERASSRVSEQPVEAWWQRLSPRQVPLVGILLTLVIFVALAVFDQLSIHYRSLLLPMALLDLAIAAFCGLLLMKMIRDARAHHRQMLQRLEIIGEMNHHIRNALEQIAMSAYASHDKELIANLHAATARIEWALREILPQDVEEEKEDEAS